MKISTHNTAQSFVEFGRIFECLFIKQSVCGFECRCNDVNWGWYSSKNKQQIKGKLMKIWKSPYMFVFI